MSGVFIKSPRLGSFFVGFFYILSKDLVCVCIARSKVWSFLGTQFYLEHDRLDFIIQI